MLTIEKLTMRFGGLTAVSELNLTVNPGEIVSVIGPNGAGKTTVFNVVTGIYAPTVGKVLFEGKSLVRKPGWKLFLGCLLVGAFIAGLGFLFSVNMDRLFLEAIKRPYRALPKGETFEYAKAWTAAKAYYNGELTIELEQQFSKRRKPQWAILAPDGSTPLAKGKTQEIAEEKKRYILEGGMQIVKGTDEDFPIEVRDASGKYLIDAFPDEDGANAMLSDVEKAVTVPRGRRELAWKVALAGGSLAAIGTFAVWWRSRRTTDHIALGGIARTFQNIRLFGNMTVAENILVGLDRTFRKNAILAMLVPRRWRPSEEAGEAKALELLKFVGLETSVQRIARNLPYGDQRRLEIARALACQPKLLLLDEPAAGMNPSETVELMALIKKIRDRGVTVLLIEHHMNLVMGISDRIAVLDYGKKIAEGTPNEIKHDPRVIEAYLGKEEVS